MKIHIAEGKGIIHNPAAEHIPLLEALDSSFRVESMPPQTDFKPKFQLLRKKTISIKENLFDLSSEDLKNALTGKERFAGDRLYSRLDILHALSLNAMAKCRLCLWNCGVNRFRETGRCSLGSRLSHGRPFNHIAEETPINTAIVVNFEGCGMRCEYCISHEVWEPRFPTTDPKVLWDEIKEVIARGVSVNTLEFTNPTESVAGVYGILSFAPPDFKLPVVANCNAHGKKLFYQLIGPVTDVVLIDVRYGNDSCAKRLSGVDGYMEHARIGLDEIVRQGLRTIVRILVLPGHVECCHEPALQLLEKYKDNVWVSILDQYVPEHNAYLYPEINRTPTQDEISKVRALVHEHNLRDIAADCLDFWK